MKENLVTFKGNKDGIYIYVKEGNFETIKKELDLKLKKARTFFNGGKVLNFKGKKLTFEEKEELKGIIKTKYGLEIEEKELEENKSLSDQTNTNDFPFYQGINEGNTKFLRATVRSGQCIEYEGNIVVLGDVNPGGVIIAKGNIVVLGSLRGIAIAGSDGNRNAIVAAFNLQPTQLRIADIIARCPDNEVQKPALPEIASVKDNVVVIEPYLPKK